MISLYTGLLIGYLYSQLDFNMRRITLSLANSNFVYRDLSHLHSRWIVNILENCRPMHKEISPKQRWNIWSKVRCQSALKNGQSQSNKSLECCWKIWQQNLRIYQASFGELRYMERPWRWCWVGRSPSTESIKPLLIISLSDRKQGEP